ncbi:MAG: hypothetical protein K6E29_00310 [Cyanobacteria bacterium RUI128]|nr:hypothetical protein [Cyanobacteria bacterium RUI128]
MNITPVLNQQRAVLNNNNNINNVNRTQTTFNRPSSQVSFGSSKSERMLQLLDHSIDALVNGSDFNILNKMKFHRVLSAALPELMVPENFVNNGRASKVYRISDRYVAKIRRGYYPDNAVHAFNTISLPSKKFRTLDFYYGEPVVKIGKVEILRNATPTENHICCGTSFRCDGLVGNKELAKYESEFLPICSEVPQESYDNLAANLKKLNGLTCRSMLGKKQTYVPDIVNPNNLLISDNRFVLVDELEKVPFRNPNSVFTMLEPLLIRLNPEKEAPKNEGLKGVRKNIFKKVLIASEKSGLPLDSPIKYEYSEWTLGDILGSSNILGDVKEMRAKSMSTEERIANIKEILD